MVSLVNLHAHTHKCTKHKEIRSNQNKKVLNAKNLLQKLRKDSAND